MFSKIKNKLKNVFQASQEVIEDENSLDLQNEEERKNDEKKIENTNKKGFFNKILKEKDKKEIEQINEIENIMLEDVKKKEIESIHNNKKLDKNKIKENKIKLEKQIQRENDLEKETLKNNFKTDDENKENENESFISKAFKKLKSKEINQDDFNKIWLELQLFLLEINIAFEIVEKIEFKLKEELIGKSYNRFKLSSKIREVLENEIEIVLKTRESNFIDKINQIKSKETPVKILILGVNGTGKTTSIAKIVNYFQKNNFSVVVAAADTFRAAATEQLEEHSNKLNFKLIMHKNGSDPAAVAFDAIEHAKAKKIDIVLIDTAGRMPNNSNLMNELEKIKRVSKANLNIFIGDSISGNDLIEQIELFDKGIGIDGIILTKVDTDEKPGSIVSTAYKIEKPIYFLGIGQEYEDLIKFDSKEISKKLFEIEE